VIASRSTIPLELIPLKLSETTDKKAARNPESTVIQGIFPAALGANGQRKSPESSMPETRSAEADASRKYPEGAVLASR
jgi:hypothetical protein